MSINAAQLLGKIIDEDASDLHIVTGVVPYKRLNTELSPVEGYSPFTDSDVLSFLSQITDEQQRQILDINKELDFSVSLGGKGRFRVNAFFQKGYLSIALRHIPLTIPSFEALHLPQNLLNVCNLRQGLILVVGPTGQGKSTTLAAMIDKINETRAEHVVTIEDPIEYIFTNKKSLIEQREMYLDTNSWESALKSVLRQDPNVVLIGELRDAETMKTALQIAETGHLVFSTMHTNSAAQTVERMIASFPAEKQLEIRTQMAQVMEVVISQRLLRSTNNSVIPALEIMLCTDAVKAIIRENKSHMLDNVINTSYQVGMISLERSLANLVLSGQVDFQEALLNTTKPEEVKRFLGTRKPS
jgi:twitching motility protein PilT